MLKSELARELGLDASVMSKKCREYFAASGKPDERVLSAETVEHLRKAARFMENHSATNWREAISRALGQYTDPVPSKSVRDITQRLDRLEASLSKVAGEVEWIATYLRKRAEQQGGPRVQAQGSQVVPPVPGNDSRTD